MQIIPTVNEKEFGKAEKRIVAIGETSKWVQVDVADGILTPGKSFELELLSKVQFEMLWDVHLRVREPLGWIKKCIFAGASRIIGQVEMMKDRKEFVRRVKNEGMEAGIGFDIGTKIEKIPAETDMVLIMGRKAGFEEKPFDEGVYEKIKKVKEMGFRVGIDGGVNPENIDKVREAGVDVVYSGNYFFDLINA